MNSWLQDGNAAVITGGANGIGLAAAQHFAKLGMNVVVADIDQTALDLAMDTMSSAKGQVISHACDVSDYQQMLTLKDTAFEKFGRVDCLMNNAGASVTRAKPWDDLEGWKKQQDINLWGIIHGCHAFIPTLLTSSEPVVVINTGSKQGITNPPGGYAYNMSKAGVINYTQSVAHELAQIENSLVSAHLLIPGFTYSNMIAQFVPEKPAGAWSAEQVVEFMLASLEREDFYIICPDNDTPRSLDNIRMQWSMSDLIENRPALSRWHPDYAQAYEAFVAKESELK